jgi:hypothetical protein
MRKQDRNSRTASRPQPRSPEPPEADRRRRGRGRDVRCRNIMGGPNQRVIDFLTTVRRQEGGCRSAGGDVCSAHQVD